MSLVVDVADIVSESSNPLLSKNDSWERVRLGDIAHILNGFAFSSSRFGKRGMPLVRIRDVGNDATDATACRYDGEYETQYVVQSGDLLVGMDGEFRAARWTGPRALLNQRVCKITTNSQVYAPGLLDLVLPGYLAAIHDHTSSQTVKHLSSKSIAEIPLPLPPFEEQQRIVTKVEELLARVSTAREHLAGLPRILKRFRQSVLAAACSGRLTEDWRDSCTSTETGQGLVENVARSRVARREALEKMPARTRPSSLSEFDNLTPSLRSDLDLPDLPETWTWVDLRFLMSPEEAFCYGVVQPGENIPGGPRLIRVCDIDGGTVQTANLRSIPLSVHEQYSRSILRGGEVLVTVVGTIGRSAVAPPELAGANIARAVAKLPIREFNSRFIDYWMTTDLAQQWMVGDAREVARKTLNLEQLRTLPCPVPSLPEQEEIVRRIDALFGLAENIERRIVFAAANVGNLTQSILAKAFRGELVPTEAELAAKEGREYEPASVLLERIRAARKAPDPAKPRRRRQRNLPASTR